MTATVNLLWNQGATFRRTFVLSVRDDSGTTPRDLTGCTARMQVRTKYGAPVLLELTTDAGITLGTTGGELTIEATAEQTDALGVASETKPRTAAAYDVEVVFPDGDVLRAFQGTLTISPNITRGADE